MTRPTKLKSYLYMPAIALLCWAHNGMAQERNQQSQQAAMNSNQILVLSAVIKDKVIADAEVIFQRTGKQSIALRTNERGLVTVPSQFLDDPESLIIIKKEGYSNLVSKCKCSGLTYALSPKLKNLDAVRVVLNWGYRPRDLDLHVRYGSDHVYYSNMKETNVNLDVDDTDSYGPETITVEQKRLGDRYRFFIHDYSNRENPSSRSMSNSSAQVYVYIGSSLIKTFEIPVDIQGNVWHVFDISPEGELIPYNTVTRTTDESRDVLNGTSYAVSERVRIQDPERALEFNSQGEAAYRAGNYNEAISLYRKAIEHDNNLGQAYSNLGLAYYKNGNKAEALWANRKAIGLASGSNAHVIKASSYFNIAKVYEDAGQYGEAFRHYKLAKEHNNLPAYQNAIKRVKPKIR